MTAYLPPIIRQLDGSAYGGTNCNMCSSAMAVVDFYAGVNPGDTGQPWPPTGSLMRHLSGDTSGGTNLGQAFLVMQAYKVPLHLQYRVAFDDLWAEGLAGRGFILQGGYAGFQNPWRGSEIFTGNHAVLIPKVLDKGWAICNDPLYDGRRPGIPSTPQRVPKDMLRRYASFLRFEDAEGDSHLLGDGLAYAATYDAETIQPAPPPSPVIYGRNVMIIGDQGMVTSKKRKTVKKGTPVFREPGGVILTYMAKDARPHYLGYAGSVNGVGYQAVLIGTKNFPDHVSRSVIGYMRYADGPVS